ncbi:hypothetical protein B0H14DRAFT_2957212, partial [Mycena olivaceomarginata]
MFYLPHNVDIRRRTYPLPPHLNHAGDDLLRGLPHVRGEESARHARVPLAQLLRGGHL